MAERPDVVHKLSLRVGDTHSLLFGEVREVLAYVGRLEGELAEARTEVTMWKTRCSAALEVANRYRPQCSDAAMEGEGK